MREKLELIAAVFTPFDSDGSVDLAAVSAQARRLMDDEVDGAFVCGTTGEGMSMTTASPASTFAGSSTPSSAETTPWPPACRPMSRR